MPTLLSRRTLGSLLVGVAALASAAVERPAAQVPAAFTLDDILSYPFPDGLVAAPSGNAVAWTFSERGQRNLYVAAAPGFAARRVTSYSRDDGQQLTSLAFSSDGARIVYVRGGDHGSNFPAEGNLAPNPAGDPTQPKVQVWSVATSGGTPVLLGDGDFPVVAPRTNQVAFERDRRLWITSIDGSTPAEQAFFARGTSQAPTWSPDGRTLAFVSNRDDHSFIGLFTPGQPIRYLAPSTSRDSSPAWSRDGKEIAWVRQPGRGGTPRSPLLQRPSPWAIWVAPVDAATPGRRKEAREAWKSGAAPVDSPVRTAGAMPLQWAADDRLVFMSYQDGWPHLYTLQHPGEGTAPLLLTSGAFMVEHASLTPDGRTLVYAANTGSDQDDIDRRHLFTVPVDAARPVSLTSGRSMEWAPVVTSDGATVVFLSSTAQRSPLPAVLPLGGGTPTLLGADRVPTAVPTTQLVTPEPVIFKAPDGVTVHGQLFKTAGGAAKRPALIYVHGGPQRQMLLGWHYMDYYANDYATNQFLASRGFVVLSVNYRLGIGYGHAFHFPEGGGARGASEYQDVLAAAKLLQARSDVDEARVGIWGGSYGGYLTALALGRNSDVFAAGVDIHGVHNWNRFGTPAPDLRAAWEGDGITEDDLKQAARTSFLASPVSAVSSWKSPVLLIHGDDDRNVEFHQTVDLKQRLAERKVSIEELVIPDDIHGFLLFRTWTTVTTAAGEFLERVLMKGAASQR
ncbi:MAG: S9 family peptidase [Acidobacteria bacterium]|nr:S9 family peptidase [Acidobacteriota bacterium]